MQRQPFFSKLNAALEEEAAALVQVSTVSCHIDGLDVFAPVCVASDAAVLGFTHWGR